MSRLTKRNYPNRRLTELRKNGLLKIDLSYSHVEAITNKLADYEDLEEQGRLVYHPYRIGDRVWHLVENYDFTWDISPSLFMGVTGDYIVVTSEYIGYNYEEQLAVMCEDMVEEISPDIYIFHKSNVFKTKEEAEAKLKELKGTEDE